ncbi:uncharacterized protein [Nicotiana tomentosiformis]|uniref:uncharacterized protein n=1 Tax=Nicotiana tomentosiformis TaxID=4098 RepID=UPI00388C8CD5
MTLYENLYGRQFNSPVSWFEPGEVSLLGTNLVHDALERVKLIQEWLRTTQSKQKSYADRKVSDVAYMEGEKKYREDRSHILDFSMVQLDENLMYEEEPVAILD